MMRKSLLDSRSGANMSTTDSKMDQGCYSILGIRKMLFYDKSEALGRCVTCVRLSFAAVPSTEPRTPLYLRQKSPSHHRPCL